MERRKHPRQKMDLEVDVTSEHNFVTTRTLDASEGGLFVASDLDLPIGSAVQIALSLDGLRLQVAAEVTWSQSDTEGARTGFGVRFIDLGPVAREAITRFMKKREPLLFDAEEPEESI